MQTLQNNIITKESFVKLFENNKKLLENNGNGLLKNLRQQAIQQFEKIGFPTVKLESWKNTNINEFLKNDYIQIIQKPDISNIDDIFTCDVPDLNTFVVTQVNGWYYYKSSPLTIFPDGTIIGSLAEAIKKYPELIEQHYGKYGNIESNGLNALNTAFAQDGIFIFVPDNVKVKNPIQIVNLVNAEENIFIHPRNLVIMGKNSSLTLIHCHHSAKHKLSFINSMSEIFMDEGAKLDHYKLQNKDNSSFLITSKYFYLKQNAQLLTNTIVLNGGMIRNEINVKLDGQNADAKIFGLYLPDGQQHVDNQVRIEHLSPDCTSTQLFKGIIDDEAHAVFNGYIKVHRDAQHTQAYQSNKNILLTNTAEINTQPFLEIYADDVKCSHGATVGQLDDNALFYIKSRGISENNARMLLMYAFALEVIEKINIPSLKVRIDRMLEKRLKGELSICDQCVLNCQHELPVVFHIDKSKI